MKLNRTWRGRADRSQSMLLRYGTPVLVFLAAFAGLHAIWQVAFAAPTDVVGPARSVVNRSAVVGSFAQDCVTMWLLATSADAASLGTCFSVQESDLNLPSTPAVVISTPTVVSVTFEGIAGKDGDAEVYSVVVGVTQRPFESASPVRALYAVPVLVTAYGPRAMSLPARVGGPGAGADLPMDYPVTLAANDPAFKAAEGFLAAFLTSAGGVERYTTASALIVGLGDAYQSVRIRELRASRAAATEPVDGESIRVLARIDAVTSQYAPAQMVYPLTLQGLGGRWVVAAIDTAPAISIDDQSVPVTTGAK